MTASESDRSDVDVEPGDEAVEGKEASSGRSKAPWIAVGLGVVLLLGAGWFFFLRDTGPDGPPAPVLETLIEAPASWAVVATDWVNPSAISVDGDRIYVLDTGNNRILSMDAEGVVDRIICETDDCALLLDAPEDMEYHDGLFYVANTEKGRVDVVTFDGTLERSYELPVEPGVLPRATGVHVAPDGTVYVADGTSGKIAVFDPDGEFTMYFGADTVGEFVFTDPTGIDTDDDGNLYVAEYSLGRVRKIAPIGRELATFWMIPGETKVSEAADVVVADDGMVYMADFKRSVVQVFSVGARHLGILGLIDASRVDSPISLLRPAGVDTEGDQVFVIDWKRGLQIYTVDPEYFEYRNES